MHRMAQANLKVLPVVSRADIRKLMGTISMQGALAAFGLERAQNDAAGVPSQPGKAPIALLAGVLAVMAGLIVLGGVLNFLYRSERTARAKQYFEQGNVFLAKERYQDAVEQYRNALSIGHTTEQRLALADALTRAGRLNEADIYFRELLRTDPNNGPANLGYARVAVARGDAGEAVRYYRKAIYGSWPSNRLGHSLQVRIELVKTMEKLGRKKQARAELLALAAELPEDPSVKKQVASMLLDFGLPRESSVLFRDVLEANKQDPAAYAGLGDAEFELGKYRAARDAYTDAVRRNPADEKHRARLQVTEQILDLDPTLRGLGAAERYRRSRKLIEASLGVLDQCLATRKAAAAPPEETLADSARKILINRRRPRSYSDAADQNIALAEQLWQARTRLCGAAGPANEPLETVLQAVSR